MVACSAVILSISGKWVLTGGPSGKPVRDIIPPRAWPIGSKPTLSL